jgi:hypothetical protein
MLEWLFGSKRRNDRTPDPAADRSEFVAEWDSTSRQDWTVPDTYFQRFGWKLQSGTGTQMTWTGKFGGTMTFTRDSAPAWTATTSISMPVAGSIVRRHARETEDWSRRSSSRC